ncbi:hypothetical protein [Nitrosopumilus sp.]|uniref:hypothetical protein n=1 Tax=Nitrosopumilus sp. TaxID=2024843 RepID=UPI00292CA802|nr:hypothetical protein [Nitrosopumilus sp.]
MKIIILNSKNEKIRIFHHPIDVEYKPRSKILTTIDHEDKSRTEKFLDVKRPQIILNEDYEYDNSELIMMFVTNGGSIE